MRSKMGRLTCMCKSIGWSVMYWVATNGFAGLLAKAITPRITSRRSSRGLSKFARNWVFNMRQKIMRAGCTSISQADLRRCLLRTAINKGNNMVASKDSHKAVINKADILAVNSNIMASNMATNKITRTTSWRSLL